MNGRIVITLMDSQLERLLSIAGPHIGPPVRVVPDLPGRLVELLARTNGFYAFESALHVLPSAPAGPGVMTVQLWNDPDLWRNEYGHAVDGYVFFAEDAFGGQFALAGSDVVTFDPETADTEVLASDLEGWAGRLLADYEVLTGCLLAHAWQKRHGPLSAGIRLVPRIPFVLGGQFDVENLYPLAADEGMRFRGHLAMQTRDLPDGTTVRFKIVE